MKAQFNYQRFQSLSDNNLFAYLVELLNDATISISDQDIERIKSELETFDDYHLIFAIEVGMDRRPDIFLSLVPKYLAHPELSVRLAVHRTLLNLPEDLLTDQLIEIVEKQVALKPRRSDVFELPLLLSQRRRSG
jgi:hypothetical protein